MTKVPDIPPPRAPRQDDPGTIPAPNTRRSGLLDDRSIESTSGRPRMGSSTDKEPASRRGAIEDLPVTDTQVVLRVVCEAGSDILESTHAYVTALAKSKFRASVAERVSVSCWELLSNALSYGSVRRPVILELCDFKSSVEIRVTNDSIAARCQMLEQRIDQLKRDAKGTYLQEMRRSMSGGNQRATLGLAWVAHESKMDLSCSLANGRVLVSARCSI